MARYANDHFTKLTADLTLANSSSIDALQVTFLQEMTDQIAKALMDEKRKFNALVMATRPEPTEEFQSLPEAGPTSNILT
jgi:hypothetical protein